MTRFPTTTACSHTGQTACSKPNNTKQGEKKASISPTQLAPHHLHTPTRLLNLHRPSAQQRVDASVLMQGCVSQRLMRLSSLHHHALGTRQDNGAVGMASSHIAYIRPCVIIFTGHISSSNVDKSQTKSPNSNVLGALRTCMTSYTQRNITHICVYTCRLTPEKA